MSKYIFAINHHLKSDLQRTFSLLSSCSSVSEKTVLLTVNQFAKWELSIPVCGSVGTTRLMEVL